MKILIAMDSFKGSKTSLEVANIVEKGIRRVYPNALVDKAIIADGGEGTVEAIVTSLKGEYIKVKVKDPLGRIVKARYGIVKGHIAIIEMAEASGLHLVPEKLRNPLITSTYGTGQLIKDAIDKGCKKIVLGIGGSATNDGGTGMAEALGVKFYNINDELISPNGGNLDQIHKIDILDVDKRLADTEFQAACDVSNPLFGIEGSSYIYAPQKGANKDMVEILDKNLKYYSNIVKKELRIDVARLPGTGAAGGLGYGLVVFCNAKLVKGIDMILDTIDIEKRMKDVDIVITGEGRIDNQTIYGKVPIGIASRAKKYGKPVYAIAGCTGKGAHLVYDYGIDAVISSITSPLTIDESIKQSSKLIEEASERLFRIIKSSRNCFY